MCFVPICEHAAVWVLDEHHNEQTCEKIGNDVAILFKKLEDTHFCQSLKDKICNQVIKGGISTECHDDVEFDSVLYHDILDCIPHSWYHKFDELFPQTTNIHGKESSLKYKSPELTKQRIKEQLEAWKKETFF